MPDERIVTVTLNPAIDRVLEAPGFKVGAHVQSKRVAWYPAGKGVNVSRVLATLGSRSIATGLVGKGELGIFEDMLAREGAGKIITQLLVVRGRTRDNTTIVDPIMDTETHIRDEGMSVKREDVKRIASKIAMLSRTDTLLVLSGSLPPGFGIGDFRSVLHRANELGTRIIVDTSESVLPALRGEPMWMVKLNAPELAALSDHASETTEQAIIAARALTREHGGQIEYVLATRGAEGAILIGPGIELFARVFVHPGRIVSTVGSGDALLGGVLHEWLHSRNWERALKKGVATATANATTREAGRVVLSDVEEFEEATTIERI
jgi:1-phosphofructokinase family hexose kinase